MGQSNTQEHMAAHNPSLCHIHPHPKRERRSLRLGSIWHGFGLTFSFYHILGLAFMTWGQKGIMDAKVGP